MSFEYGNKSFKKLETCHPILRSIAFKTLLVSPYDITIVHGWRGEELQNYLYSENVSKVKFPNSRHNKTNDPVIVDSHTLSDALDFAPYVNNTIYWNDTHVFSVIAGCFMSVAKGMGYTLRWGGDWDSDGQTTDQSFMDWGHLEMVWSK